MLEEFEKMNYRDLQKLAKTAGVKANLPKAELIKALQASAVNAPVEGSEPENAFNATNMDTGELNTTFDKETADNTNILNTTFEKDDKGNVRRSSGRLSVSKAKMDSLETESRNSPKPRKPNTPPAKAVNPRINYIRKQTPRTSGGKVAKVVTPRTPAASSIKLKTPITGQKNKTPAGSSIKLKTPMTGPNRSTPSSSRNLQNKDSSKKALPTTNIPRFVKFARKAPDFSKIHEKEFNRMESLSSYLDKKKKRTETAEEHFKKTKTLKEEHNKILEKMKARTPAAKFVPAVTSTTKLNLNFGSQTPAAATEVFKFSAAPAVVSGRKPSRAQMGVKKITKEKTAGKLSTKVPAAGSNLNRSNVRTPVSKPFGNITNKCKTPLSGKKAFDLKASLAKPLGYKPHTGKLPTWGEKKNESEPTAHLSNKDVMEKTRNIIRGVRMNKRAALLLQNRNLTE